MLGANPLVSHGSVLTAPRIRDQLRAITARGGRVVVVDPRRTETARQFEHVAVRPTRDAWLLALDAPRDLRGGPRGPRVARRLDAATPQRSSALAAPHKPEAAEARTGVAAGRRPRTGAGLRRRPTAPRPTAAPARASAATGRVVAFLLDALNAVTGNLDRPGGAVFGRPSIAIDDVGRRSGLATYGSARSRVGDFPDVIGNMPASLIPREIETPGRRAAARAVRERRQPGAVRARTARRWSARSRSSTCSCPSTSTSTRRTGTPTTCFPTTTFLERDDTPARLPRLLHDAVRAALGRGRPARGRGPRGVGDRRGPGAAHRGRFPY